MAELLIITRNPKTYSHRRFLESARDLGHLADTLLSHEFCGIPENLNYDLVLHRDSGVSYDDVDLLLAESFEEKGLTVINNSAVTSLLRGKDKQHLYFKKHELPHIPTLISRGPLLESQLPDSKEFVLKTIRGNQGRGVMLLSNKDSLLSVLESNHARGDERYIIQPRLNFSKEYRVLLIGDEVVGVIEKVVTGDFRANAKRSETKIAKLPSEVLKLTEEVQSLIPGQFLGLDIGLTNEGPVLIEINTTPGFEVFDELHQCDVAKKVWESYL